MSLLEDFYFAHTELDPKDTEKLLNKIDWLKAELAALKEANRRIPVSERLPKAQERVLAYYTSVEGKERTEIACYIPPKTVLSEDFLSEEAENLEEYDEENK